METRSSRDLGDSGRTVNFERTRILLEDLEQTLLRFIRKHEITHDEYRRATDLLGILNTAT
jgi:hypothetical protein